MQRHTGHNVLGDYLSKTRMCQPEIGRKGPTPKLSLLANSDEVRPSSSGPQGHSLLRETTLRRDTQGVLERNTEQEGRIQKDPTENPHRKGPRGTRADVEMSTEERERVGVISWPTLVWPRGERGLKESLEVGGQPCPYL